MLLKFQSPPRIQLWGNFHFVLTLCSSRQYQCHLRWYQGDYPGSLTLSGDCVTFQALLDPAQLASRSYCLNGSEHNSFKARAEVDHGLPHGIHHPTHAPPLSSTYSGIQPAGQHAAAAIHVSSPPPGSGTGTTIPKPRTPA